MAISVAQARQICTKSELELVVQSTTQQIGKLDAKQLKAAIRRARRLRDKWRDLAASQTRNTKVENPEKLGKANARSDDKAQLFDEVLGRFEKRLTKVEPANAESPSKRATKKSATTQATTQATSKKATVKKATVKKATVKKATVKKTPTKKATSAPATSKRAAVKKKGVKKATAKKTPPTKRASRGSKSQGDGLAAAAMAANREIDPEGQPTKSDKKRNLKATTAAKATAVERSGAPRIQGHVSSQGRRNQAKRNVR